MNDAGGCSSNVGVPCREPGARGARLGRGNAQPLRTSQGNVAQFVVNDIALPVARNHAWLSNNSAEKGAQAAAAFSFFHLRVSIFSGQPIASGQPPRSTSPSPQTRS
eukprot:COSAG06_NODE_7745_length_2391_cov_7.676702_1_plen_107_part_00